MPKFLLQEKTKLDEVKLAYKVTGDQPSKGQTPLFILDLPNIYYGSKFLYQEADQYDQQRQKNPKLRPANFIFVDYPGTGESDKIFREAQCNIDFFADALIAAVDEARQKLGLNKIELMVLAAGESSKVAFNMLNRRPDLANPNSPVQLKLIAPRSGSVNSESSITHLKEIRKNDPQLPNYIKALTKLENGDVDDMADLLKNVEKPLLPLVMEGNSLPYRNLARLAIDHPKEASAFITLLRIVTPRAGKKYLDYFLEALNGCNIGLLNHFQKTRFNGFDIESIIHNNLEAFSNLKIVFIDSAKNDLTPSALNSHRVQKLLPDNVSIIEFAGGQENVARKYGDIINNLAKLTDVLEKQSTTAQLNKMGLTSSEYKRSPSDTPIAVANKALNERNLMPTSEPRQAEEHETTIKYRRC